MQFPIPFRNFRTLSFGALVACLMFWCALSATMVRAQALCSNDYFRGCEAPVGKLDCLDRLLACGSYDVIVSAYDAEHLAVVGVGTYYTGVAYFGLYQRARDNSYRCSYSQRARSDLLAFMADARKNGNLNVVSELARLRHAVKLYEKLGEVAGCRASSVTRDDVKRRASEYSISALRGLFLPGQIGQGAFSKRVGEVGNSIATTIEKFVGKAEDLETNLALREQAMAVGENVAVRVLQDMETAERTDQEEPIFGFGRGTATWQPSPRTETSVLASLKFQVAEKSSLIAAVAPIAEDWAVRAKEVETALHAAMGGVSLEEYDKMRRKFVSLALKEMNSSKRLIRQVSELFDTGRTGLQFRQLDGLAKDATNRNGLNKTFGEIRDAWVQSSGNTALCEAEEAELMWFCPRGSK